MTQVRDLMDPPTATVWWSQSILEATRRMTEDADTIVVLDLSNRAAGLITRADVDRMVAQHPQTWTKKRCACLTRPAQNRMRPDQSIEGVIWRYQREGVKPLLVFNGEEAVGVLHPGPVLSWCAEHHPAAFEKLGAPTEELTGT